MYYFEYAELDLPGWKCLSGSAYPVVLSWTYRVQRGELDIPKLMC
jgi:hypothetical protein